jgi:hypothetical protein
MRSSTVKDDLAIARDWRSLVGTIALFKPALFKPALFKPAPFKPMWIDAHRAGNALMAMASRTTPVAV